MNVTEEQLRQIMPACASAGTWIPVLVQAMAEFDIDNLDRTAAFLSQIAHESTQLTRLEENLNYSAARLVTVFPKRFPSVATATPYAGHPERLANRIYGNRLGNGPEDSGDGWRFRGRGVIQLTGRGNYRRVGKALALDLEAKPEQLLQPGPAARSAAFFWQSSGCNELADDSSNDDDEYDFKQICTRVNGGLNGLPERRQFWKRALSVLSA